MQRLGTTACLFPLLSSFFPDEAYAFPTDMDQLLEIFVKHNDDTIRELLERQENDAQHRWFGAVKDPYGIHNPQSTVGFLQRLSSAYVSETSRYFQDETLLQPLLQASHYLLNAQHPDGTIDLHATNFHSTPDLGFSVESVSLAYTLLTQHASQVSQPVTTPLKTYLMNAGRALRIGGIHTPNHRWVVCMALARIHHLFPDPLYVDRVNEWLNEKIDIDEDGQYTEQSTLIYSPTVNRALITIARLLHKPELLEPVRKNLEMSLYLLHVNGEGVSESSCRQDQYQRDTMHRYYYAYRYMALHDQHPQFAAMAQYLEEQGGDRLSYTLAYFLEDTTLKNPLPPTEPLPTNYLKILTGADLVRIRRGDRDATILAKNPVFFTFFKGNAVLEGVRLASAFFGIGQFEGEALEREGNEFVLRQWLEGPYFQPHLEENLSPDGNWEKMPREDRPQSEIQKLLSEIRIRETHSGFLLDINILGTDRVPVVLELAFRQGSKLEGVRELEEEDVEEIYILEEGYGMLREGEHQIRFGPGRADHEWTQLRGALPKPEAQCVYLTGFTPFKQQITIE